jgi:hypothetical protein
VVNDEEAIEKCVEELTSAIQEATAASALKRRPRADPRPSLPASIQDEIRLKNQLRRQWQVTRDPALKAQVNCHQRSVTYRLNEQWSETLECLDSEVEVCTGRNFRILPGPSPKFTFKYATPTRPEPDSFSFQPD